MLNLLWYLLIGVGAFVVYAIDELIVMKANGISIDDYIDFAYEFGVDISENLRWFIFTFIWGLVIWPIRIFSALADRNRRIEKIAEWVNKRKESDYWKNFDKLLEEVTSEVIDFKETISEEIESNDQES